MTNLSIRGILYDVGSNYEPTRLTREVWNAASVERDLRVIATDLGCNAVLLFGTPPDRLAEAGRIALHNGLEVWIQPRRIDGSVDEVSRHIAEVSDIVQELHASRHQRCKTGCICALGALGGNIT